ncbi:MAG: hypothetical protein MUC44_14285 [Beijerinckiaceae bacterium]|jgi:hypothetical protein|nr:hypothetical protein [Beijerinckiaceae bacterium]
MGMISKDTAANRVAQLSYLAEDKELVDLLWKISALPADARLIVSLMVSHLSQVEKARKAG